MRVPQVNERVKEAPAQALRAMFAGIGQLLLVTDRFRNRNAEVETATEEKPAAEPVAATEVEAGVETVAPEAETAPETVAAPETEAASLPLANYDELTIPSLRARLRNLSADQLTLLIDYEKSNENRTEVVAMFERRIVKLAEG
jgi:hypothetical protein